MAKSNLEMLEEAKELKEKRELMSLSAADICKECSINQGNYSRMERGLLNCTKPLIRVREMYVTWVEEEQKRLKEQADYLLSIK